MNVMSKHLGSLAQRVQEIGQDLGNTRLDVRKVVTQEQVWESELSRMDEALLSQGKRIAKSDLLFRANDDKTREILQKFGLAIQHHSDSLTELRRELRRLSTGKTDQSAETRIVPYKQRDVVLYNPPPPDVDE